MDRDHARPRVTVHGRGPALVVVFAPEDDPPVPTGPNDGPNDAPKDAPNGTEFGPDNPYRLGDLSLSGLAPQLADLKRATYIAHVTRSSKKHTFVAALKSGELGAVDGTAKKLWRPAAEAVNRLFAAARADLQAAVAQGDPAAVHTTRIGVNSAYRSVDVQFGLWDGRFVKYCTAHRAAEFGDDNAPLDLVIPNDLAKYIGGRTACPGYSKHQRGKAIDFLTVSAGKTYAAGSRDAWRSTWLWNWLVEHAAGFEFAPYNAEPWHWNYEGAP